jgi:hypothetical protein
MAYMNSKNKIILFLVLIAFFSCESEQSKKIRLEREEQERVEIEQKKVNDEQEYQRLLEKDRIEQEAKTELERKEKEIYDRYISNSLKTGSTPYAKYYGRNSICTDYGCSKIKVTTSNSDVIVTIKENDRVVRHAYIEAGHTYVFSLPNGSYQTFFYYGTGWNPNKEMKGGKMQGGFISGEDFGKDEGQMLFNNILTYELIMQPNGNFSTSPSSQDEAL